MKTVKRILVPTDFEEKLNVVLDEAIQIANHYDAEIHILHVNIFPIGVPFASTYFDPEDSNMKEHIDSYVDDKFAEIKKNYGDEVKFKFVNRSAERVLHGIEEYVKEKDIDLIIMSSHGRKAFLNFFLGSIAEEAIRHSPVPVMIVKEEKANIFSGIRPLFLVPIDFSEFSKNALIDTIKLAKIVEAKIHLIHTIPNAFQLHVEGAEINIIKNYPDLIKDTEKALKKFFKAVDSDYTKVEYKVLFGVAAVEITDYAAQNNINMIFLSSHGLTGIKKFFIGNVAEKIVRMADCPVLIYK